MGQKGSGFEGLRVFRFTALGLRVKKRFRL